MKKIFKKIDWLINRQVLVAVILLVVLSATLLAGGFGIGKAKARSLIFGSHFSSADLYNEKVIVKFKAGTPEARIAEINQRHRTKILRADRLGNIEMEKVGRFQEVSELIADYQRNPEVEYAEPNYLLEAQLIPNDPYWNYQWHLQGIKMPKAWDLVSGAGAVVAIIDTGVAYEDYGRNYKIAPDLAGTSFVPGYDFVNDDEHANDDNGHGTHLAGTIAQATNNNIGVAGIAYRAAIMPIKVLDKRGRGSYYDLAQALIWATDHGAKIINLSVGGTYQARYLEEALAHAYNNGVTIVAASGNSGRKFVYYPAAYDQYVIAVGATRFDETKTYYSNFGAGLDLVAPGGDLRVDQNGDRYGDGILQQTFQTYRPTRFSYYFYQGTSMAAAHVSGIAALLWSRGLTQPAQIREALEQSAKDKGPAGWDENYGFGLVDAAAALSYTP